MNTLMKNIDISEELNSPEKHPEKAKLIKVMLNLLLHVYYCKMGKECKVPRCQISRIVHDHMTSCQDGESCTVPCCYTTRQIESHWKECSKDDCLICKPMREKLLAARRMNIPSSARQHGVAVSRVSASGRITRENRRLQHRRMTRVERLNRTIQTLIHSTRCPGGICEALSCSRMKQVMRHVESCTIGIHCDWCRQFFLTIYIHSQFCNQRNCFVPGCKRIKSQVKLYVKTMCRQPEQN